ncbi:MAG TPA: hypothetical protein VK698_24635 [Kofleriaceae bacterium]|nr:hypothetical protein [Kofleriaceae bacterium]
MPAMPRRLSAALLPLASFLALTGCSRSSEPAPSSPAASQPVTSPDEPKPATSGTGGIGAPNIPWADKTHAQRLDYMGLYVLTRMEKRFKEWRPGDYSGFRCQTCHGENFDKPPVDFHMPRVSFPLSATDPIGGAMKYDPEATKFMMEVVVPTMADLLGEKPYDPKTKKGFGCLRCHPAKGVGG